MTTSPILVPLVGAHFRPPAKQVLAALSAGCQLILVAEPENPYDFKAVKVLVDPRQMLVSQHEALATSLAGTGWDLGSLLDEPTVQLGYVGDSEGKVCQRNGWKGNGDLATMAETADCQISELTGTLVFDPSGQAMIRCIPPAEVEATP